MLEVGEREMKAVLLVGTCHKYQVINDTAVAGTEAFECFIERICGSYRVAAIGEEMNPEALRQLKAAQSVCKKISDAVRIPHRYCDPDNEIRSNLNIVDEQDIRTEAFFRDWDESKVESEVGNSHSFRELYWLGQIMSFNIWPLLFVCGSNHIGSFSNILQENHIEIEIIAKDWKPPS